MLQIGRDDSIFRFPLAVGRCIGRYVLVCGLSEQRRHVVVLGAHVAGTVHLAAQHQVRMLQSQHNLYRMHVAAGVGVGFGA